MASITTMSQRLRTLRNEQLIISLVFEQIKRYEGILIDYVQGQLEKGQNPKGEVVGTYSRATELESLFGEVRPILPKREGDPFNFQWTGGFFNGMFLQVDKKSALFGSNDKQALLEGKYGDLLGLQVQNWLEAKEKYILPSFIAEIRKILDV